MRATRALWVRRAAARLTAGAGTVVLVLVFGCSALAQAQTGNTGPVNWLNQPPAGDPFPPSHQFSGVTFTGPYATYGTADTWYPSWGADGNLTAR